MPHCFVALRGRMPAAVCFPQTRDFQPVFDEFAANLEMFGDLLRSLALEQKSPQRGKRHKGCGPGSISGFLIHLSILSRYLPATRGFRDSF